MNKLKLQNEELKEKNTRLSEENRINFDKVKALEEKTASTKLLIQNLKNHNREKDNELNRVKDSVGQVDSLRQENTNSFKRIDDQQKKIKQLNGDIE